MKHSANTRSFSVLRRLTLIGCCIAFIFLLLYTLSVYINYRNIPPQFGVVVTQKQYTLVMLFNLREPFVRSIVFDNAVEIEGVHGVGTYSLTALKKLGETDGHGLTLLQESLEEAIAYPLRYAIDIGDAVFPQKDDVPDVQTYVSNQYKLLPVLSKIIMNHSARLPVEGEIAVYRVVSHIPKRNNSVYYADIKTNQLVSKIEQNDGSISYAFDPLLFDQTVSINLEDSRIRSEQVTASIYNTTTISGLGKRMERYLVHLGVQVLDVGSKEENFSACKVLKKDAAVFPYTSQFLKTKFGCEFDGSKAETSSNDISVYVGSEYAKRFEPTKK